MCATCSSVEMDPAQLMSGREREYKNLARSFIPSLSYQHLRKVIFSEIARPSLLWNSSCLPFLHQHIHLSYLDTLGTHDCASLTAHKK